MTPFDPAGRPAHFPDDLICRAGELGRVLEIGVGAGFDAARFCRRGVHLAGIDSSPEAIAITCDRLQRLGFKAELAALSFRDFEALDTFSLIFDRGVFHNQKSEAEREAFAMRCASNLTLGGHWISIIGSADDLAAAPHGAFYLSNVVPIVERYFEVLAIDRRPYGPDDWPDNFAAWHCLFRKRVSLD